MNGGVIELQQGVEAAIRQSGGFRRFAEIVRDPAALDDATLADLIELDGRTRIDLGVEVSLQDYLDAVPNIPKRADPLDAAIDVALRSMSRSPRADPDAVAALVAAHPDLRSAIREAAALGEAIWSTTAVRREVAPRLRRDLPSEFGSRMEDGRLRYELREFLGAGAFGDVYLAADRQLSDQDRPALVAIKIFAPRSDDSFDRHRFAEEATKSRRIDHPNAVRVFDRGVSERNEDFIVYEYVEGGSLVDWAKARGERPPARDVAALIARIARGVQAAHSAGLVHCDLKPTNIMMTARGEPKVGDFGIAVRLGERVDEEVDGARLPVGNLAFMSPEQHRLEDGALGAASDIYALGGILYWLLTRRHPNGETPEDIARTHDAGNGRRIAPSVREHRPDVDRDLDAICRRAMAPDPADRYTAPGMLAEDLEAWRRREPIRWMRPGGGRILALWVRRRPLVAALVLAIGLSIAVGGFAANHYATEAQARAYETQITALELREANARREGMRRGVMSLHTSNSLAIDMDTKEGRFTTLWITEWLGRTTIHLDPAMFRQIWADRIRMVENIVAEKRELAGADTLETLLWETALAFWRTHAGDYAIAEPLLTELEAKWRALLSPSDPWLLTIEALRACAAVDRIAATTPESRDGAEIEWAKTVLMACEQRLAPWFDGAPVRLVILERLARLHSPELLDQPALQEMFDLRITSIRDSMDKATMIDPAKQDAEIELFPK